MMRVADWITGRETDVEGSQVTTTRSRSEWKVDSVGHALFLFDKS